MPRGYELDSTYDALRAITRKMYSTQIKIFSSVIEKMGFYEADAHRLIIASLNDGIYQNLGGLYSQTYHAISNHNPIPKSARAQDYMSPMELRLNAIAVRRATRAIKKLLGRRFSLRDVQDICYSEAHSVANDFLMLNIGKAEFEMRNPKLSLSSKPIIKKYDHALVMGTLPKGKTFTNEDEKEKKQALIRQNNILFGNIKNRLIELGMTSMPLRQSAFARFNGEFYETDAGVTHTLEISKIIITDKAEDYISIEELEINCDKLKIMESELQKINRGMPYNSIYKDLEKAGAKARQILLQKYKKLPELYSGFYHTYIDADKKIAQTKN